MRVIVCGPRDTLTAAQRERVELELWRLVRWSRESHDSLVIVHGCCRTGVDKFVDEWCIANGVRCDRHPPKFEQHGSPAAFHIRNQAMADAGAALCLSFWDGRRRKNGASGTADMLERAARAEICGRNVPLRR